jgi:hypothetical protein
VRRAPAALALAAVAAAAVPAAAAPSASQTFFRGQVLADTRTSDAIVDLLRHGGGFVAAPVQFADLTGDGKEDAVVRVDSGGAAGVVALFVFSTDGTGQLHAIYRNQRLDRASTRLTKAGLSYATAVYAAGDELCCPSATTRRALRWDAKHGRLTAAAAG